MEIFAGEQDLIKTNAMDVVVDVTSLLRVSAEPVIDRIAGIIESKDPLDKTEVEIEQDAFSRHKMTPS